MIIGEPTPTRVAGLVFKMEIRFYIIEVQVKRSRANNRRGSKSWNINRKHTNYVELE